MTTWLPDLSDGSGPLYLRLAEHIERDIEQGVLAKGAKLPPQRNLAFDVGVTIGTVSRAYAVARERGLVSGEVGRGTYVLGRDGKSPALADAPGADARPASFGDPGAQSVLRMDSTAAAEVGQAASIGRTVAEVFSQDPYRTNDYTRAIKDEWREAGARWLSSGGWRPEIETIVPVQGVLSGIETAIAAITSPGDKVAFEDLSYSALARGVALMGRRVIKVRGGEDGLDLEDFRNVCAREHPKVLVVVPTFNNPTLSVMPEKNRRRIAEIAHQHNVWIVEDNIYGDALEDAPTPFAAIAPERTIHVSGVSKTLSAGLRAGWASCPANLAGRMVNAKKLITGGISYAMTEVTARLVLSGEAARLKSRVLEETRARVEIARKSMAGYDFRSDPHCGYVWLKLPDPWLPGTYKKAALERGILIDDADAFKVGQVDLPCHYVRIGFTSVKNREDVQHGFDTLNQLLRDTSASCDSME